MKTTSRLTSSSSWSRWPSARLSATLSTALGSQCSAGCRSCVLTYSGPSRGLLCHDMVSKIFMFGSIVIQLNIAMIISTSLSSQWPSVRLLATLYTLLGSPCSVRCQLCVLTSSGPLRGLLCQDMVSKTYTFRTILFQMIIEMMMSSSSWSRWPSVRLSATLSTASGSCCSVGCRSCVLTSFGPLHCKDYFA